ncbi:hypothetical protein LVQ77_08790 [Buttiauxella sp. S04-F03]|uniref:hypothetical protein n=1 Tax=Buttiauxella sp. W03-F01 TaxID=2904524 RepID=UPI001E604B6B|nr:hypothetical protein [Buttiauxella sp. W03-F01]MCE0800399.1 hypothetical protein [Buttiauxella sp. W03-F01]
MKSAPLKTDADGMSATFVALTGPGFMFCGTNGLFRLFGALISPRDYLLRFTMVHLNISLPGSGAKPVAKIQRTQHDETFDSGD